MNQVSINFTRIFLLTNKIIVLYGIVRPTRVIKIQRKVIEVMKIIDQYPTVGRYMVNDKIIGINERARHFGTHFSQELILSFPTKPVRNIFLDGN